MAYLSLIQIAVHHDLSPVVIPLRVVIYPCILERIQNQRSSPLRLIQRRATTIRNQTTDESIASDGSIESEPDVDDVAEFQEPIEEENIEDSRASNSSSEDMPVSVQQLVQPPTRGGLVVDFEVRWNSTFVMLDRFITHRAIVNEMATGPSKVPNVNLSQCMNPRSRSFQFSSTEWSHLIDLHSLMKPFFCRN